MLQDTTSSGQLQSDQSSGEHSGLSITYLPVARTGSNELIIGPYCENGSHTK